MNDEGAGRRRGSGADEPTGGEARERVGGWVGHDHGRRTGKRGRGGGGGATTLLTQRPEWAACVDLGARTAWREVAVWRWKVRVATGCCKDVHRTVGRSRSPCETTPILVVKLHEGNAAWRCDTHASLTLQQAAANVDVHHQCAYVVFLQWRTFQAAAVGRFPTARTDWPSPRFTILREIRLCVPGNTNSRQEMPERC